MKEKKTIYCNPLVLPDYPLLVSLSARDSKQVVEADWDRPKDRIYINDRELIHAVYPNYHGGLRDPWRGYSGGGQGKDEEKKSQAKQFQYGPCLENDVRSTADPTCCNFNNIWYLYCTDGMIYESKNYVDWRARREPTWEKLAQAMAPTVEYFHGVYYAAANFTPLHKADSPLGPWEKVDDFRLPDGRYIRCGDPMIFADGDRLYLYWGLGDGILGAELNPDIPNQFLTEPEILILFNPENEWERFGANHENWQSGCLEGSWMYKKHNRYYLLYSAAGTEFDSYAMGAYVSEKPLTGFVPQKKNPVSCSRAGLIRGGGHGSVVEGPNGTAWCFYTIPMCIDHPFERRIGMDPCGIDKDGNFYALTGCSKPQYGPGMIEKPEEGNSLGLEPVTVSKPAWVSSYSTGHKPLYAIDECLHTWWEPADGDQEPELRVQLSSSYYISALRVMWKDIGLNYGKGIFPTSYQYVVEYLSDEMDEEWKIIVDASENDFDLSIDFRIFERVKAAFVRIRILGWGKEIKPGLLNFTVFGESSIRVENQYYVPEEPLSSC